MRCGWIILAWCLSLLAACAESSVTGPEICRSNSDCRVGEDCLSGRCQPVLTGRCQGDLDCPRSMQCVDGACASRPERPEAPLCTSSSSCERAEVCLVGRCRSSACLESQQCPADAVCSAGLCRYAPFCAADDDCAAVFGRCVAGRCDPGCESNRECGGTSNTACEGGACLLTCTSTLQCRTGERCQAGLCRRDVCEGFSTANCPEGQRCNGAGQCEPLRICLQDRHCDEDERCEAGLCESRSRCMRDRDCDAWSTGRCEAGFCTIARACSGVGQPCLAGERCVAGACTADGCRSHDECLGQQRCASGVCQEPQMLPPFSTVVWRTDGQLLFPGDISRIVALPVDAVGRPDPTGRALRAELGLDGPWRLTGDGPWALEALEDVQTPAEVPVVFRHRNGNAEVLRLTFTLQPLPAARPYLRVVNAQTGAPIPGAHVRWPERTAVTDALGLATVEVDDPDDEGGEDAAPELDFSAIEVAAEGYVRVVVTGDIQWVDRLALEPLRGPGDRADGQLIWPEAAASPSGAWVSVTTAGLSTFPEGLAPSGWFGDIEGVPVPLPVGQANELPMVEGATLRLFALGLDNLKPGWTLRGLEQRARLRTIAGPIPTSLLNEALGAFPDVDPLNLLLRVLELADGFESMPHLANDREQLLGGRGAPHRALVRRQMAPAVEDEREAMMMRCDQTHGALGSVPLLVQGWAAGSSYGQSAESLVTLEGLEPGLEPVQVICWLVRWSIDDHATSLWPARWSAVSVVLDRVPTEMLLERPFPIELPAYDPDTATWRTTGAPLVDFLWWGVGPGGERAVWLHRADGDAEVALPEGFAPPQGGSLYWMELRGSDAPLRVWPAPGQLRSVHAVPAPP